MKKKIVIAAMIVLIILAAITAYIKLKPQASNQEVQNNQVSFQIRKMALSDTYSTTGTVYSENDQTLTSPLNTLVKEVKVTEGQNVKKGDVLFVLDTEDLQNEIASTRYNVESAKANLNSSEIMGNSTYLSSLDSANTALSKAQSDYQDAKALFEAGAISQSELTTYEETLANAKDSLTKAQKELSSYNAKNEISLSQENLTLLENNLASLEASLDEATIVAPFDGVIAEINVKEGDSVTTASTLARLVDLSHLGISSSISEYDVNKLAIGQKALISQLGNEDTTYDATLTQIGVIGQTSGSEVSLPFDLQIDSEEAYQLLKPNFTATINIVTQESPDALVVPFEAVTKGPDGSSIVLKQSGDESTPVIVQTGISNEIYIEVISDELSEGDTVVYNTALSNASTSEMGQAGGLLMFGGGQGSGQFEGERPQGGDFGGNGGGGGTPPSGPQ